MLCYSTEDKRGSFLIEPLIERERERERGKEGGRGKRKRETGRAIESRKLTTTVDFNCLTIAKFYTKALYHKSTQDKEIYHKI